ncbi:MAG: hypothetical protein DWQ36_07145 [Acidobacteria bacterium]|nr:MAG: hypothetical protein DWQ30_24580 [Acidobacteriota bacterium]REK09317.1 MAG: hypothetical protein DWQ36_07145 [Acidobacteriota bacterium]
MLVFALCAAAAFAAGPRPVYQADGVWFETAEFGYESARLTLYGPAGLEVSWLFGAGESPVLTLQDAEGEALPDGRYEFELRLAPIVDDATRARMDEARAIGDNSIVEVLRSEGKLPPLSDLVRFGAFRIEAGALVSPSLVEPRRGAPTPVDPVGATASANGGDGIQAVTSEVVLTNANGVIRNALCVGFDCPDSPAFGDSSVLMMENNNRIKFGDTSNSPFPNNDWEIEANSSLSGGLNYLGFNDCGSADNDGDCADDLVFAVEAGARASALHVESDGDVGIGTQNPVLDLHIVTGNTPALRLEQDGSSGFAPQTWDVAGNETSFFVRDATNGSTLPFRIRPGSPSNAIVIDVDGDVGMGTLSPEAALEVASTSGAFENVMKLENNSGVGFILHNTTSNEVFISVNNGGTAYTVNFNDGDGAEFSMNAAGNVTLSGTITTTGGTCGGGCDLVFSEGYELPSIEEHAAEMWAKGHLPNVGPTPENAPIDLSDKTGRMLNELEHAHIYIEQLHNQNRALNDRVTALEAAIAALVSPRE